MSIEQKLIDQGASCVAGQLLMKHTVLGNFRNGVFIPTDDGLRMAEIDDAVIKSETPKKTKAKKAEVVDAPTADPVADQDFSEFDELLK